jgi:5'-nucleotidase
VDNTLGTTPADEYGTASVNVVLPSSVPAGVHELTVTGAQTGTTTTVPITVDQAVSSTALTATGGKVKVRGATTYELAMTATVTLSSGMPPVGTVTFLVDDAVVGTAAVGTGGTASLTVPATKGSVEVRAQFTPTDAASSLGSTSPTLTVTVK